VDVVRWTPTTNEERPMRLTAAVTREGTWYVAQCLELDVASQGETVEDALANLQEALALHFEDVPDAAAELRASPIIAPIELNLSATAI
jgi:predicted RNase H-like HicB family nuclease